MIIYIKSKTNHKNKFELNILEFVPLYVLTLA